MTRRFRIVRLAVFVALVAVTTGCASINGLRDAQDAFNQAATAETRAKESLTPSAFLGAVKPGTDADGRGVGGKATDPVGEVVRARAGYAATIAAITKIENDSKELGALKQDKLLGVALTLKALAQWRLGLYEDAKATAEKAEQQAGDQLFPRDAALVKALPGLIRNDEAFRKIYREWPNDQRAQVFTEVIRLLDNAHASLNDARALAVTSDKNHPVLIYLIQAQLAGYQNRRDAYTRLGGKEPSTEEKKTAQGDYCALKGLLEALKPPGAVDTLADWRQQLVLTEPQPGRPADVPCR